MYLNKILVREDSVSNSDKVTHHTSPSRGNTSETMVNVLVYAVQKFARWLLLVSIKLLDVESQASTLGDRLS